MSANKYGPYVMVIPEDDQNRQLAIGFRLHHAVLARHINIAEIARGWRNVLGDFRDEHLHRLRNNIDGYIILLIDFDGQESSRLAQCKQEIPEDVSSRVFVIGAKNEPKDLKSEIKKPLEEIGMDLADECFHGIRKHWASDQLAHNASELSRMVETIKDLLFE